MQVNHRWFTAGATELPPLGRLRVLKLRRFILFSLNNTCSDQAKEGWRKMCTGRKKLQRRFKWGDLNEKSNGNENVPSAGHCKNTICNEAEVFNPLKEKKGLFFKFDLKIKEYCLVNVVIHVCVITITCSKWPLQINEIMHAFMYSH